MTPAPSLGVVGCGLIGTSVALAARAAGWPVRLFDADPVVAGRAADLGAGEPGRWDGGPEAGARVDLALIATPPAAVAPVLRGLQDRDFARTYTDVASIKARPALEATALGCDLRAYVGGHPMAGRERTGPGAAQGDLFVGRSWVLVPGAAGVEHLDRVRGLVEVCRARVVLLDAATHDETVALVSHAPQVIASLLAAQLGHGTATAVELAGQGFRDVTRIADSDPDLWADILSANAEPVVGVLEAFRHDLETVIGELRSAQGEGAVRDEARLGLRAAVAAGARARDRLPGKHGAPATAYDVVPVVIPDEPGALARLFADAGAAGINVEDVRIEHSPGQPVGLVELAVRPAAAQALVVALRGIGWTVHR